MAEDQILGPVDHVIIISMLVISGGIGIYYRLTGGKQKTAEEYFIANRSMSAIPIGIVLVVSFMSAITLLGVSSENYFFGAQFVLINISYLIGIPFICYGYLPVFFKLQASSTYEYLEKRFGVSARLLASIVVWLQMLLYSGVVLYAPALALETTTGLTINTSILSIGFVCAFYSSIGGIKAVLITDLFQAVLMFACLIMVIVIASSEVGIAGIWNIAKEGGRLNFNNFSPDPTERHTWWSLLIGGFFTFLSLYGVNQIQVQRLLTVKSLKSARTALWICLPVLMLLSGLTCFSGLAIYSKYHDCDPKTMRYITESDMLMPYYVIETMGNTPGLPGLFIAGIFSAGLSTISATLNSLSVMSLEDYIKPCYLKFKGKELPISRALLLGKILAFTFGLASIALAIVAQYLGNVLQTSLTIFGVVGGPLLGLFTLGMVFESVNQRGAVLGTSVSLIFLLWIAFGYPRPGLKPLPVSIAGCNSTILITPKTIIDDSQFFYLYRISYLWYAPLGVFITITIALITSNLLQYFGSESKQHLDPNLFVPCVARRIIKRREAQRNLSSNIVASQKYTFNENDKTEVTST